MADTALALGLVYALCCLALVVSAVRFSQWLLDSELREKQFYAAVCIGSLAACSTTPGIDSPWHTDFFQKPDHWHTEWIARVRADKL